MLEMYEIMLKDVRMKKKNTRNQVWKLMKAESEKQLA